MKKFRYLLLVFLMSNYLSAIANHSHLPDVARSDWKGATQSLSKHSREVLEIFFQTLIGDSEAGYVIFGSKPVCVEGIFVSEEGINIIGEYGHRREIFLKEGINLWNQLKLSQFSKNIFIHAYETPYNGWKHLIVVNRRAFLKVVEDNLSLFQSILGPSTTPEKLFDKLLDPKETFSSVLNENNTLVGIVLGFGTQNSIKQSRIELIHDFLRETKAVPYRSLNQIGFNSCDSKKESLKLFPSFGYENFNAELESLGQGKKGATSFQTNSKLRIPIFACWESAETDQLINAYLRDQSKIIKLLESPKFLDDVLEKLFESS